MKYTVAADTDAGTVKDTNQDSVCVRCAQTIRGSVVMAVVCDGMGGLAKGELASSTAVKALSRWFETELPGRLKNLNWQEVSARWAWIIGDLNGKILNYGKQYGLTLGTTLSGILVIGEQYMTVHVGDSRIYRSGRELVQLTEDQTVVEQDVRLGRLTREEARSDPRRNVLLQCIGASDSVLPEIRYGTIEADHIYMLCTDGLRHELSQEELQKNLNAHLLRTREQMQASARFLINTAKERMERDNITVVLIRANKEEG